MIAELLFEIVKEKTSLQWHMIAKSILQKVQAAFLKCTDVSSWEEAKIKFPKYGCSEMFELFKKMH